MRTTRAFIASFGTSALLVASSVAMLAVVSAVLAYRGIPGTTTPIPQSAVVAKSIDKAPEPIRLSRADIQAANNPEPDPRPRTAFNDPGATGSASSPSNSSSPANPSSSSPSGNPGPAPEVVDDPPDDSGRNALDRVRDVPNTLRDTVNGVDLGGDGRELTRKLSDDVVSKVSPKLGERVKKTTEPLWKILDRKK